MGGGGGSQLRWDFSKKEAEEIIGKGGWNMSRKGMERDNLVETERSDY
jgi:hypothetical protein